MKPRVGHIQFLNSLPLYHCLVKNRVTLDIDLFKDTPKALCRRLLSGELDISPVPAIEYARNADKLLLLPDLTISSDGLVMSINLISKFPIEELDGKMVALTNTSATSQVLTKIILKEKYGLAPSYFDCPPDLPQMFREADAALLIGDDALRANYQSGEFYNYDLGLEWKNLTNEKMVYAVWCVRRDYATNHPNAVQQVWKSFLDSMQMSRNDVAMIAEEAAQWSSFSQSFLREYFQSLKFEFDSAYQQGFQIYLKKAHEIGELDRIPVLEFNNDLVRTLSASDW